MDTRNGIVNTLNDYTILAFGDQKQLSEKRDIINQLLKLDELKFNAVKVSTKDEVENIKVGNVFELNGKYFMKNNDGTYTPI